MLVTELKGVQFPELVAELADLLLRLEGIETVLSMGYYSTEMILSIRTSSEQINAGDLIGKLVEGIGSAGGHGMMAGGKVDNVENSDSARAALEKILTDRMLAELAVPACDPLLLVP